jgi:hypothetical protein
VEDVGELSGDGDQDVVEGGCDLGGVFFEAVEGLGFD